MSKPRVIVPTEKIIVSLGVSAAYLDATKLVKKLGGKLPSEVLLDECFAGSGNRGYKSGFYAPGVPDPWAREFLVHPERYGKFKTGDIADSKTGWILPESYVPKEAIGKEGIGLFVNPKAMPKENGKRIVHPAGKVVILYPFIQESGRHGMVDKATGIPLALKAKSDRDVKHIRQFFRVDGIGVRNLLRGDGSATSLDDGQYVDAGQQPGNGFGVALELEIPAKNPEGTRAVFAQVLSLLEEFKNKIERMGFDPAVIESSIRQVARNYRVKL